MTEEHISEQHGENWMLLFLHSGLEIYKDEIISACTRVELKAKRCDFIFAH